MGMAFVKLKDWSERTDPKDSASAIIARAWGGLSQITDATIFPINLPAIPGLGVASGFNLQLQDRNNLGHEQMVMIRNQDRKSTRLNSSHVRISYAVFCLKKKKKKEKIKDTQN